MDQLFRIQHELIADRSAEAWYLVPEGTSYHYRWSFGSRSGEPFSDITDEHRRHAVLREDPSLTMSWGLRPHDYEEMRELEFEWASQFVNKSVTIFWVDFFWNNALVDRVELARVDGGHGLIPLPDVDLHVSDFEEAVAYLIHELDGGSNQDNPGRYLDRIGAKRVPDEAR